MKSKIIFGLLLAITFGFKNHSTHVQTATSDILGIYINQEGDAQVRIFLAQNGKYSGKVHWMKEPNDANGDLKKDFNNPNKDLRDRTRLGLVILKYYEFDESDQRWEGGTIYDPKNGKTYSGYMKFEGDQKDKLNLRGYVAGIPWLGRTATWTRVKK